MLALLANIFGGGIVGELAKAYRAREEAKTDAERIAADERINHLNAIRDVQRAEAGSRVNQFMRAFIAVGPALYLFKIFAVDKVICPPLGLACRTDALSPELWQVVTAVIGFYFLYEGALGVTRIIKR